MSGPAAGSVCMRTVMSVVVPGRGAARHPRPPRAFPAGARSWNVACAPHPLPKLLSEWGCRDHPCIPTAPSGGPVSPRRNDPCHTHRAAHLIVQKRLPAWRATACRCCVGAPACVSRPVAIVAPGSEPCPAHIILCTRDALLLRTPSSPLPAWRVSPPWYRCLGGIAEWAPRHLQTYTTCMYTCSYRHRSGPRCA